jgi:hypothetical protein
LNSPFFYLPQDSLVPGVLRVSDLDDVVALWSPRPIHIEGAIDGLNQRISGNALEEAYVVTRTFSGNNFVLRETPGSAEETVKWLVSALRK